MKRIAHCQYQYCSTIFSYQGKKTSHGWDFHCKVDGSTVNTREFPKTLSILKKMMPGVLQTECFNEYNDPFILEVTKTEIGHLFEHVLLYLLLQEQMKKGLSKIVYEGRTSWNWKKNPRGDFWVRIWGPNIDNKIFQSLIDQATKLIEIILVSKQPEMMKNNSAVVSTTNLFATPNTMSLLTNL